MRVARCNVATKCAYDLGDLSTTHHWSRLAGSTQAIWRSRSTRDDSPCFTAKRMHKTRDLFPSVLEACFLVFLLYLIEYFVVGLITEVDRFSGIGFSDTWGFVAVVGNGILFSALLHYKGQTYRDLFHATSSSVAATLAVVGIPTLMMVPGTMIAMTIMSDFVLIPFPMSDSDQRMFQQMMTGGFGTLLVVGLIGPVLEEMLFRGIFLRSFLNQYSRTRAIVLSSLIFGAAHFNVYQFVVGFFVGLLLGWLYERTRSLWPCIVFHVAYNSLLIWLGDTIDTGRLWSWPLVTLMSVAITIAGAAMLRKTLAARANGG